MPIYKPRLSRAEEATCLRCLRRLQAEGTNVEIPEEWLENLRAIDIVMAGPEENTVFETSSGGILYAVLICITALRPVTLTDCDLSTEYDGQIVCESFDDRNPVCNFGGQTYQRGEILNQRIEDGLRLSRGETVEGWLLVTGLRRVPIEYADFAVPFDLIFWDQFGNEYRADGRLSVLRKGHQHSTGLRWGSGLNGLDATQRPGDLSPREESKQHYDELVVGESGRRERTKG